MSFVTPALSRIRAKLWLIAEGEAGCAPSGSVEKAKESGTRAAACGGCRMDSSGCAGRQGLSGVVVDGQVADTRSVLRTPDHPGSIGLDNALVNPDPTRREVDVGQAQGADLTAPSA